MPDGPTATAPTGPPPSQQIQTIRPKVGFKTDQVPPSQYLYMRDEDSLNIVTRGNTVATTGRFAWRWLTAEGEVKEGTKPLLGFGPGAANTLNIPMAEGWLLSFSLQMANGGGAGQWGFAQVYITRASAPTLAGYGLIFQDYIPLNTGTGWPQATSKAVTDGAGTLRSITGTTPAAGAEISETVPNFIRWNLVGWRAILTTNATVANRNVSVQLTDGTNAFFKGASFQNQPASLAFPYSAINSMTALANLGGDIMVVLPIPIGLKTGFKIQTVTAGLQAGDQWSAPQYLVQEWGLSDN